jgi:hypothetical protein
VTAKCSRCGADVRMLNLVRSRRRIFLFDIEQPVRCWNGSRTSALGNCLRREQGLQNSIKCSVTWSREVPGETTQPLAANQQNHNDDEEQKANRASANIVEIGKDRRE